MTPVPTQVPTAAWSAPPEAPALEADAVHVWRTSLAASAGTIQRLEATLTADEVARARRFYLPKDRDRFIVGRGLLRSILGRYLHLEPGQLRFRYGPHGKPSLAVGFNQDGLRFNASYSGGLGLYALAQGREIGVDVEWIRPDFPGSEVADRFFSRRELATLGSLPADKRQEAFFACWTLKEAYTKGIGEGLALGLDRFDVSAALVGPWAGLTAADHPPSDGRWALHSLAAAPGYAAAVAVEGHVRVLKCWEWPGQHLDIDMFRGC